MALIEREHAVTVEAERLWKERDDLLETIEELLTECDFACQERADA